MKEMQKKNFNTPEETRVFPKGKMEVLNMGGSPVVRSTFEPGWRWSESIKLTAKTDSCQVYHLFSVVSGKIGVRMDDGSSVEFGPGDVGVIPPGHNGWVVGDKPCVLLDFGGSTAFAMPAA